MSSVNIQSISKRFGDFAALKGIDLNIADQEFLVLLGASGCGKSTLLRIIAGLESADAGTVHVDGERIDHLQAKDRRLSMVFQNYAVFPHMTVFENIAFGLRMQKVANAEVKTRVQHVAELVHLEALLARYSGQLSGGQRQRVALARALAVKPRVILMDEPLSNLDALLRLEMRAELKTILAQSKTTAIYVTHDQVEAMSLADRIAIMNQGVIVQCATPLEIYRNPVNTFVAGFIGSPPMNFVAATSSGHGEFEALGHRLQGPRGHTQLTLGVRPEDMSLTAQDGLRCTVSVVEPLGAHTLVTSLLKPSAQATSAQGQATQSGNGQGQGQASPILRAALASDLHFSPGQALHLLPEPSRVRWYDAQGQLVS